MSFHAKILMDYAGHCFINQFLEYEEDSYKPTRKHCMEKFIY